MKRLTKYTILCPHCGAEYLPAEIYLPQSFLGAPTYVERDDDNKIMSFVGTDVDLTESYRCDFCNKKFKVKANLTFNTISDDKYFDEEYKTKLEKPNLFLKED